MDAFDALADRLLALTRAPPPEGALLAGLARIGPDGGERAWIAGRDGPGGPAVDDPGRRIRVASVTKMAVARAVLSVMGADAPVPPDLVGGRTGLRLRHLLSHTSGLTDAAGYLVAPDGDVRTTTAAPAAWSDHAPGTFFRYSNCGYVVAGAMAERATGRPLGAIVRDAVLRPAGIGGGLNWFGVPERGDRLAAWQWTGGRHERQVDGPDGDWDADVIWRDGEGLWLRDWTAGRGAWFSPQGGLRASVAELARLARFCGRDGVRPEWVWDGANGMDGGGLFRAHGLGATVYDGHPEIPGRLWGHAGHALGVSCGAWWNPDTRTGWAYALNGWPDLTEGRDDELFFPPAELALMRAFAAA